MSTEIKVKKITRLKAGWLVVKADEVEVKEKSEGGLELPDDVKAVGIKRKGTVIQLGPEVVRAQVGERVLFSAYSNTTIEVDGEEFEMMPEDSILAGIE